ncbi:MAG: aminopeptidase [Spirochaetales bacterium]
MTLSDQQDYANLILSAVNFQQDQSLLIKAEPGHWYFIATLSAEAYRRGAKYVHVRAEHANLYRARVENSKPEHLGTIPAFRHVVNETMLEEGWAIVSIKSPDDPDALEGLDSTRHGIVQKTIADADYPFRRAVQADHLRWIVVAVPTPAWAAKVLMTEPSEAAAHELWRRLKPILRLDTDDPIAAWQQQRQVLEQRRQTLDALKLDSVHFEGPGTDLTVGLSPLSQWEGGGSNAVDGLDFMPNIPTEEVFTTPDFRRTEGTAKLTRPVQVLGSIVTDGWLRFEEGKVVDFGASSGADILDRYFDLDERARYLGELALVDTSSPIYRSGLVFYNTLLDENAACHVAVGSSYPKCLKGGNELSPEEYEKAGGNTSKLHTDLMISSPETRVTGTTGDGAKVDVIVGGRFVI